MFLNSSFKFQILFASDSVSDRIDITENHISDSKVQHEKFSQNPEVKDKTNIIHKNVRDMRNGFRK